MYTDGYVMGIDAGTESIRVGIFDLAGNPKVFVAEAYPTYFPKQGWAEQNPDEWENALKCAIRKALHSSGIDASKILGISMDATIGTIVFMDGHYRHLGNSIIWMDVRAVRQFEQLLSLNHPALALNPTAEWPIPKIMWIKENLPEVYRDTKVILEYTGWLIFKLTGNIMASLSHSTSRWFYNSGKGGYPFDLFGMTGLDDLQKKLPDYTPGVGEPAGSLLKEFAAETGLPSGIPVAVGCPDGIAAMVGLNAFRPGKPVMICGTSHVHLIVSDKEIHTAGIIGSYPDAVVKGLHTIEGGQVTTGAVLKWYRDHFLQSCLTQAAEKRKNVYEYLDSLALKIPVGSEGLILLEYFQGNRTPYQDANARGMLWGLSLKHTPAHIYRAILEGVAYGTNLIFHTIRSHGVQINQVVACGGMTKSALWLKIHADMCNIPISITEVQEASILGSAIVAAKNAGMYRSLDEAANYMVREKQVILPDGKTHEEYLPYYDLYCRTYPQIKGLMKDMGNLLNW